MTNTFRSSVAISIQSESKENATQQENTIEVRGEWVQKGGFFFLQYREEEKSTSTWVKWKPEVAEVWVIRQGDISVRQHFIPREDLYTIYTTPYGQFSLRTVTNRIQIAVEEAGGSLQLHFFTQVDDAEPIEHRMNIQFKVLV